MQSCGSSKYNLFSNFFVLTFFLELLFFTLLVRGMMYYRKALEIQCLQDTKDPGKINVFMFSFFKSMSIIVCLITRLFFVAKFDRDRSVESYQELQSGIEMAQAIADIKFTYVVSCQVYGMQKTSKDVKDKSRYQNILNLMIMYRS